MWLLLFGITAAAAAAADVADVHNASCAAQDAAVYMGSA